MGLLIEISGYGYKTSYQIPEIDLKQRLAYSHYRQFKNIIWQLTFRAKAALGAICLENVAPFVGCSSSLLDFVLDNFWEFVSSDEPSRNCLDTLKYLKNCTSLGFDNSKKETLSSVLLEELKNIESGIFFEIFDFLQFEYDHDYFYNVESMKNTLFTIVQNHYPLPDLSIFKMFKMREDNHMGNPIPKMYFIEKGLI